MFVSLAQAALDPSAVWSYLGFNSDVHDETENQTWTDTGMQYDTGSYINGSASFDAADQDYATSSAGLNVSVSDSFSVSAWINASGAADEEILFMKATGGAILSFPGNVNYLSFNNRMASGGCIAYMNNDTSANIRDSEWHLIVGVSDGSDDHTEIWVDGVINGSEKGCTFDTAFSDQTFRWGAGGNGWLQHVDEGAIWTKALTPSEILELYGAGPPTPGEETFFPFSEEAPSGVGDSLNISSNPQPEDTESFDHQIINFNITYNSSFLVNASLYINDTLNQTTDNLSSGENRLIRWNVTFPTGQNSYNYSIRVYDDSIRENTTGRLFYVDTVSPSAAWTNPATDNSTVLNLFNDSEFNAFILVSDPNLYSWYYNLTLSDGTLLFNYNKTNLTGQGSFTITNSSDIGNVGVIKATVESCDGHTDNKIDFGASKLNGVLDFEGVKIYLNDKTDTSSVDYVKLDDRYSFLFNTKSLSTTKSFIVESEQYIDVLHSKTKYAGHLITGNRWIDFEMGGLKGVKVTRISDTKVRVDVESVLFSTSWNFNSIGELNCIEEHKEFFAYNVTQDYTSEVILTETSVFNLSLDYNSSFMTTLSADLLYNGSYYASDGAVVGDKYVFNTSVDAATYDQEENQSFKWNYTVNGEEFEFTEQNQTVFVPSIDNCSANTNKFINFSIINEITGAATNALIEYSFEYTYGNYTETFTGETTNDSSFYEFCMHPAAAKFTTDVTIDYRLAAESTISRSYVGTDLDVNSTDVQQVSLELLTDPTEITIHVIDDSDNNLENVLIRAYRYDTATATDVLVQSEYTDSGGNAIFGLRTGTTQYSFKFYQDDVLKISTRRFKLFATSYEYVISEAAATKLSEWILLDTGIVRTLTYSNLTNLVEFNWTYSGTLVDLFCLEVRASNYTQYHYGCSSNSTGSLDYTLTELNVSYIAVGKVKTLNGNIFNLVVKYIDSRDGGKKFSTNVSISISILIFLVLFLIGLVNKNIAIVSGLLALSVLSFFGILPLSLGMLIPMILVGVVILIIMNRRAT